MYIVYIKSFSTNCCKSMANAKKILTMKIKQN